MDTRAPRVEAIAWRDARLIAVGTHAEVASVAGPDALLVDVGQRTVLPGFIDAHHHPCIVALYGSVARLAAPAVIDVPSFTRTLAAAAARLAPGAWLVATDWDEATLTERRPPTLQELDAAVPDRPLFALHYGCHRALANTRALELGGIGRTTPDPPGGTITRARTGQPTGLLIERGMSPVEALARASLVAHDREGFLLRLAAHQRTLAAAGITRVVDATVPGDLAALYRAARDRDLLTVPTVMMPVSTRGYLEAPWDVLGGAPPGDADPDALLAAGPVKLVFDGAPGCSMCLGWLQLAGTTLSTFALAVTRGSLDPVRTALSVKPSLGRDVRTGIAIYDRHEARSVVGAAFARGFSVATHAIGNAAIDVALDAYESAQRAGAQLARPRLEHATFLDPALISRIAAVGAAVVTQPYFFALPAFDTAPSIPGLRNTPLRWLLDAGVLVAGSSDFPVAGFDPLAALHSAVTRRTASGRVMDAEQCITLDEALALYTRSAAEAAGLGAHCGQLTPGRRADLVVLDGPLTTADDLTTTQVRTTLIGGRAAFGTLAS